MVFYACRAKPPLRYAVELEQLPELEYIDLIDTFELFILDYVPAPASCGILATASNCIGVTADLGDEIDTLRVLSLCNRDTTYKSGMRVRVFPRPKPSYQVKMGMYWICDGRRIYPPELHKRCRKRTYGILEGDSNL